MRVFIDEAGNFAVPRTPVHAASVAVGLAVADPAWLSLERRYREFRQALPRTALDRGEPKGRLMSAEQLDAFANMLVLEDGVSLCPVTMDMGHLVGAPIATLLEPFFERLEQTAAEMVYPEAGRQVALLARQARNMSQEQLLRLLTWSRALYETLQHAVLFLSHGPYAPSWETVRIEIDPVSQRPGREQEVLGVMLFAWMLAWTAQQPFATIEAIHTATHPFVRNFTTFSPT